MFCPRSRMLLSSLTVGVTLLASPATLSARGPGHHHYRPPVHHYHHHGGGPSLGAFLFGAAAGAVVHELLAPPRDAVVVTVRGTRYYRAGARFYEPVLRSGRVVYVPVAPPTGVIVTELPPSPQRVIVNGETYYRSGDTFYVEPEPAPPVIVTPRPAATTPTPAPVASAPAATQNTSPKYVVTSPPVGSVVQQLPSGAVSVRIGTTDYRAADGVFYLPVQVEGKTRYVVVDDPTRTKR